MLGKLPVPGVQLIWIIVGPTALAMSAGRCLDIFFFRLGVFGHFFSRLSFGWVFGYFFSRLETVWYRLKYSLKGSLNPNQPTSRMSETCVFFSL